MTIAGLRFGHGAKKVYHAQAQDGRPELMFLEFNKGQFIEIFSGGKNILPAPADPIGYIHFCLLVDNLAQALDHLASIDIKPDRQFIGRAQQNIAFISDPDGNSIELMEVPAESAICRD